MSSNKLICPSCYKTVVDNPEKHRYRDKLCPYCGAAYKKGGMRVPNLAWIKEKLARITSIKDFKERQLRGRVKHDLSLSLDHEPTQSEIDMEVNRIQNEKKSLRAMRELNRR